MQVDCLYSFCSNNQFDDSVECLNIYLDLLEHHSLADIKEFCSDELLANKQFITKAIEINPENILFAGNNLKNDFDICKYTVKSNGLCLQYLSNEMKNNPIICLTAIQNNPNAKIYIGFDIIDLHNQLSAMN